jgi:GST-like protein
MIEAYVAKGPNPLKLLIFLEEVPIEHQCIWLDLTLGEHRTPEFLKLSPSAKVPAIVDRLPPDRGEPISIFESGAILLHLAEKTGRLLAREPREKAAAMKWLFWQVAALGPMSGQAGHFRMYAPKGNDYALTRYEAETARLYRALDVNLAGRDYLASEYSVADIACYPWVMAHRMCGIDLNDHPNVMRWFLRVSERPAVIRAKARMDNEPPPKRGTPEEFRKNLFHDHCDERADAMVR